MARYKIWDKVSDIYTIGKDARGRNHFTAQEYITENAPWAMPDDVMIVVGGGVINGTVFMELNAMAETYKHAGCPITPEMTPDEILAAIEYFEDHPAEPEPSAEERIAAAMEYQNAMNM